MNTFATDSAVNAMNQNTQTYKFSNDLNTPFLEKTYGANLIFCQKMFKIFLSSVQGDMDIIEAAINDNNLVEVKAIAHKIKNNFTWVGLPGLSEQMYHIENLAREKKSGINENFSKLKGEFEVAFIAVTSEYNSITKFIEA